MDESVIFAFAAAILSSAVAISVVISAIGKFLRDRARAPKIVIIYEVQHQKDANGKLLIDSNGKPIVLLVPKKVRTEEGQPLPDDLVNASVSLDLKDGMHVKFSFNDNEKSN